MIKKFLLMLEAPFLHTKKNDCSVIFPLKQKNYSKIRIVLLHLAVTRINRLLSYINCLFSTLQTSIFCHSFVKFRIFTKLQEGAILKPPYRKGGEINSRNNCREECLSKPSSHGKLNVDFVTNQDNKDKGCDL